MNIKDLIKNRALTEGVIINEEVNAPTIIKNNFVKLLNTLKNSTVEKMLFIPAANFGNQEVIPFETRDVLTPEEYQALLKKVREEKSQPREIMRPDIQAFGKDENNGIIRLEQIWRTPPKYVLSNYAYNPKTKTVGPGYVREYRGRKYDIQPTTIRKITNEGSNEIFVHMRDGAIAKLTLAPKAGFEIPTMDTPENTVEAQKPEEVKPVLAEQVQKVIRNLKNGKMTKVVTFSGEAVSITIPVSKNFKPTFEEAGGTKFKILIPKVFKDEKNILKTVPNNLIYYVNDEKTNIRKIIVNPLEVTFYLKSDEGLKPYVKIDYMLD